jgi:hypothetical protein
MVVLYSTAPTIYPLRYMDVSQRSASAKPIKAPAIINLI